LPLISTPVTPLRRTTISTSRYIRRSVAALLAASSLSLAGASALAQPNQSGSTAGLDAASGARLPYLTRQDLGEAGKRLADVFARNGKPTDPVRGPLAFAAYNVPVANALLDLHDGAVGKGTLDADARELAILVACRETNFTFEWNAHEPSAVKAGVDPKVIDVVRRGLELSSVPEKHAAVIRFGRELLGDRRVSSPTFAKAVELFGEHGAMDLVAVMSTYAVSGFYAIAVDEHPPGQRELEPLPR
jgi:4-carboxymuconolactone decarboxylase